MRKIKFQNKKIIFLILLLTFNFSLFTSLAARGEVSLAQKLKGFILLQVESQGEAWYVNPTNEKRYFLGRPDDAFNLMRALGIGITNSDLAKIPTGIINNGADSDKDGLPDTLENALSTNPNSSDSDHDDFNDKTEIENNFNPLGAGKLPIDLNFTDQQKGKIFLQTEKQGQAWYVNPQDHKKYFLGSPAEAFSIMRALGLGITNANLDKILIGEIINNTAKIDNNFGKPINDTINSTSSDNAVLTPNKVMMAVANTISSGNPREALQYFSDDIKPAVSFTANFLNQTQRSMLSDILLSSRLTESTAEQKTYTTGVSFNGQTVNVNFIIKKQPDGKWLLTNL
jgi:hypothetical protein